MNRRELLKAACALPLAIVGVASKGIPDIVGVVETPWLKGKVRVFCDGEQVHHCVFADSVRGEVRYLGVYTPENPAPLAADRSIIPFTRRGDVRVEWIA